MEFGRLKRPFCYRFHLVIVMKKLDFYRISKKISGIYYAKFVVTRSVKVSKNLIYKLSQLYSPKLGTPALKCPQCGLTTTFLLVYIYFLHFFQNRCLHYIIDQLIKFWHLQRQTNITIIKPKYFYLSFE